MPTRERGPAKGRPWILLLFLALAYLFFHLATLSSYPFVHSDEAWLASLSRSILESRDPAVTEEFFRITPRYPHGFKTLYHLIQIPFLAFSFSPAAARLPSLLAFGLALVLLYRIARQMTASGLPAYFSLILPLWAALDSQLFYVSHLGRQEALLVLLQVAVFSRLYAPGGLRPRSLALTGLLLGLGSGLHPNAFVAAFSAGGAAAGLLGSSAAGCGAFGRLRRLLLLVFTAAAGAGVILLFSRLLEPSFPQHWLAFGAAHGAGDGILQKLLGLPRFLQKMFFRLAGTYYLPDVRLPLFLFGAAAGAALPLRLFLRRRAALLLPPLLALAGALAALTAIGKYSPPSLVFLFAPGYLLLFAMLTLFAGSGRFRAGRFRAGRSAAALSAALILALSLAAGLFAGIGHSGSYSYKPYRHRIAAAVGSEGRILANLNSAFAFEPGRLCAFRDLEYLPAAGLTITAYLAREDIEYILWPEEMDIIYRERPVWNDLYGNLYPYYRELKRRLETGYEAVAQWQEPWYGMRIQAYAGRRPYGITLYRRRPPGREAAGASPGSSGGNPPNRDPAGGAEDWERPGGARPGYP